MSSQDNPILTLIRTLQTHDVDFVVVGGVAAVLHGAPVTTFDLDTLVRVDRKNAEKLATALSTLDAKFRENPSIRPTREHIEAGGHMLLATSAGPLDVLGYVGHHHSYEEFKDRIEALIVGETKVPLLPITDLIMLKRETGRRKDIAVLPILERLLEQKKK